MFGKPQDLFVAVRADVGALQGDEPRTALDVAEFLLRPVDAVLGHLSVREQTEQDLHLLLPDHGPEILLGARQRTLRHDVARIGGQQRQLIDP